VLWFHSHERYYSSRFHEQVSRNLLLQSSSVATYLLFYPVLHFHQYSLIIKARHLNFEQLLDVKLSCG
jgi:hypothetical protein